MRQFENIGAFIQYMSGQAATLPAVEHAALEHIGKLVEQQAKRVIGTYDFDWPRLAESTQADRVAKGFPADEPLLRTGDLQKSIEHKVDGRTVHIGSNSDIAKYQELGTSKIPARSFLAHSLALREKQAVKLIGRAVTAHLSGKDATAITSPGVPNLGFAPE